MLLDFIICTNDYNDFQIIIFKKFIQISLVRILTKWNYIHIQVSEVEFYSKAHSKNEIGSSLR